MRRCLSQARAAAWDFHMKSDLTRYSHSPFSELWDAQVQQAAHDSSHVTALSRATRKPQAAPQKVARIPHARWMIVRAAPSCTHCQQEISVARKNTSMHCVQEERGPATDSRSKPHSEAALQATSERRAQLWRRTCPHT